MDTARTNSALLMLVVAAIAISLLPRDSRAESPNDILVVANKAVPLETLAIAELKLLFLHQRSSFAGAKLTAVNAPASSAVRQAFRKAVLDLDASREGAYWEEQKIREGFQPPPEFAEKSLLKAVFKLKGGVSYVFRSQYIDGVAKVLTVIPAQ